MKFVASLLLALASLGFLTLVAAPAVTLAGPQEPPDEQSGGFARTDEELAPLIDQLAQVPDSIPKKKAIDAYNLGLKYRNKALKLEEQAAIADGGKAVKKAAKAQKSYKEAVGQFRMAVEQVPDFYQALGSLGHALLKTGQYAEALEAYDRALAIGPLYAEAIEERGEAYLGLDRIEEAKGVYMLLFRVDRELAADLMIAMKRWLNHRRGDAGSLSEEAIESFAVWIEEHGEEALGD